MNNLPNPRIYLGLLTCVLVLISCGCFDDGAQGQLEFIEQKVRAGLECWQAGSKPETLNVGDAPFEFFDEDWNRGAKLLSFEIRQTYFDSSKEPRCFVSLKIQRGKKPATEVECNYKILTEPTVIVGRDPMG
jgi:hypothetical protein